MGSKRFSSNDTFLALSIDSSWLVCFLILLHKLPSSILFFKRFLFRVSPCWVAVALPLVPLNGKAAPLFWRLGLEAQHSCRTATALAGLQLNNGGPVTGHRAAYFRDMPISRSVIDDSWQLRGYLLIPVCLDHGLDE